MLTLTNRIDMRPGAVPLVIHLGQYDSDFSLVFELYSSSGNFTVESGTTAMIRGTKTDGNAYDADATIDISAKTVTVAGSEQMTAAKGRNVYELVLKKGTKVLSTANFILDVERAAMDADTIASESVLKEINAIIAGAETATEAAANAASAADRAEDAADSVSSASTQIATNTADIADLKAEINELDTAIDIVKSANLFNITDMIADTFLRNGGYRYSVDGYQIINPINVEGMSKIAVYLPSPMTSPSISRRYTFATTSAIAPSDVVETNTAAFYRDKNTPTIFTVPTGAKYFTVGMSDVEYAQMVYSHENEGLPYPQVIEGESISAFYPFGYIASEQIDKIENAMGYLPITYYGKLIDKILFCGDSITKGYRSPTYTNSDTAYPKLVSKLMSIETYDVKAEAGYTPTAWWNSYGMNTDFSDYDYLFIKLGQNGDLANTVDTDCVGSDYTLYANTDTGNYGRIIQKALTDNPDIIVFLSTIKASRITPNKTIGNLATRFGCYVVDINSTSVDLDAKQYHTSKDNIGYGVHFNDIGYIEMANIINQLISKIIEEHQSAFYGGE